VIEAVGTQESMMQAIRSTRPGGHVGYVGVAHDVELPGEEMFFSHVHLHGGPAPVRRFLPQLVDLIWNREINRPSCGWTFGADRHPEPSSVQRSGRKRVGREVVNPRRAARARCKAFGQPCRRLDRRLI
jgi:hypothetical protein